MVLRANSKQNDEPPWIIERGGSDDELRVASDRLQEEVHDNVYARERHDMAGERGEITRCTSISLHNVALHQDLACNER